MIPPNLSDYAFDPKLEGRVHELVGLEKLRGISDPAMREMLFDLWLKIEARSQRRTPRTNTEQQQIHWTEKADAADDRDPRLP